MNKILSNIKKATNELLGVEAFTTDSSGSTTVNTGALMSLGVSLVLPGIIVILIGIAVAYGAARQSYCYNIFIGNPESTAILFAILCFMFPHIYYPFYALFLNPLCSLKVKNNKGIFGGLIGGKR